MNVESNTRQAIQKLKDAPGVLCYPTPEENKIQRRLDECYYMYSAFPCGVVILVIHDGWGNVNTWFLL